MRRAITAFLSINLCLISLAASHAQAQAYPTKPIRLIIPFGPGTGTDTIGRLLAAKLSDQLGQSVVVDNRPGASGSIGAELAARSSPDGYTLVLSSNGTLVAYPELTKGVGYRVDTDFTPLGIFTRTSMMLFTANSPATPKSVSELISRMKTSQVNYASVGAGTMGHLGSELFLRAAGVTGTHIAYKGSGPAHADILRGEVVFMTDTPAAALPFVRAGRLRPLAVTGSSRLASLPDVPTFDEAGIGSLKQFYTWWGVFGPKGIAAPVANKVTDAVYAAAASDLKGRLDALDLETFAGPREKIPGFLREELKFWQEFVQQSGIKLER